MTRVLIMSPKSRGSILVSLGPRLDLIKIPKGRSYIQCMYVCTSKSGGRCRNYSTLKFNVTENPIFCPFPISEITAVLMVY